MRNFTMKNILTTAIKSVCVGTLLFGGLNGLFAQNSDDRDKGAFIDRGTSYYRGTILKSIEPDKKEKKSKLAKRN